MNEPTPALLITLHEAARLLAVSQRTIRRMIAEERLVEVRPVPDSLRVTRASVEALLSQGQGTPSKAS